MRRCSLRSTMWVCGNKAQQSINLYLLFLLLLLLLSHHVVYVPAQSDIPASCADRCNEAYFPGRPCYCNQACQQYSNCCDDYYQLCNQFGLIPNEWQNFSGHSYRFFQDDTVNARDASWRCLEKGGLLASINTQEEARFIGHHVLRGRIISAFIGGSDREREGHWVWADGQVMPSPSAHAWHQWYPGQPDNGDGSPGEHCSVLSSFKFWSTSRISLGNFYWVDHACDANTKSISGYICEKTVACYTSPCHNNATCRYAPDDLLPDQEFACDCLSNYYGRTCEYELLPGETWSFCGETNLMAPSGRVLSPLFPLKYPPHVRCDWTIAVQPGRTVELQVHRLDLEAVKGCVFDSLTFYDGGSLDDPLLTGPMCGSQNVKTVTFSSTNEVVVSFRTDGSVHGEGFVLSYVENECRPGTGESGCGTAKYFTSNCSRIQLRQDMDEGDKSCEWVIDTRPGSIINLTFHEFVIQDTGMACNGGGLAVYDGLNATSRLLGRYCGLQYPWSIQSTDSRLYVRLEGVAWSGSKHVVSMVYQAIDRETWQQTGVTVNMQGPTGDLTTTGLRPTIESQHYYHYRWLINGVPGHKVDFTWRLQASMKASLKVYDGPREDCHPVTDVDITNTGTRNGSLTSTTFSLLVVATKTKEDDGFTFTASYNKQDWEPHYSGCYRPTLSDSTASPETENHVVTAIEPVVLMVSNALVNDEPMYQEGLYCKWLIRGESETGLRLQFPNLKAIPHDANCSFDGVFVYDGSDTSAFRRGPFCGDQSGLEIDVPSSELLIVFYSATINRPRNGGIVRALITTQGIPEGGSCPLNDTGSQKSHTLPSACGVLLSPHFPRLVAPDVWTWFIEAPQTHIPLYMKVYLYYVRGPKVEGTECNEYFRLSEVPRDSGELLHADTQLLRLCQNTDLYIPEKALKLPPYQKLGLKLNTIASALYQRWEFKLAYKSETMEPPQHITSDTEGCEVPGQIFFRGHCYHQFPWTLSHYESNKGKYDFTRNWQDSLNYCQSKNGTLLTIKDEEEAYFIKYTLAHDWFWDPSGTYQSNHRLTFLGLHNRDGNYKWTDGSVMAYSDWHWPEPDNSIPLLASDTLDSTKDLLHPKIPQPTADSGSLCTVMIAVSPHGSLNWAKVPCDYPFTKTAAICKSPAVKIGDSVAGIYPNKPLSVITSPVKPTPPEYSACQHGWAPFHDVCIQLHTNYTKLTNPSTQTDRHYQAMRYPQAEGLCRSQGGKVMTFDWTMLDKLGRLLTLWGHTKDMGAIWMAEDVTSTNPRCQIIEVSTSHRLETSLLFQQREVSCDDNGQGPRHQIQNVLCQTQRELRRESCRTDEFSCANSMCISVDSVCDGRDDCFDASDELNCDCGRDYFQCADGNGCVPVSLYCDFIPHCSDGSDEDDCVRDACQLHQFRCANGECINKSGLCDFVVDCRDGSDESPDTCGGHCNGFRCYSGRCLKTELRQDLISDCPGLQREDERALTGGRAAVLNLTQETLTPVSNESTTVTVGCSESGFAQCLAGEPRCFDRSQVCVYDTSRPALLEGQVVMESCRNGFHLRRFCGEFDCPGMFHCPDSYCIPYSKVCDGVKDCPLGQDEKDCTDFTCPGLLKCKGENHCVPHDKVCDNEVHCLVDRTDEKYCDKKDIVCLDECSCTAHIVSCVNVSLTSLPEPAGNDTRPLRALLLSGNALSLTDRTFANLHWLGRLDLSRNRLTDLGTNVFRDLTNLFELDLSDNSLGSLEEETFSGLGSLRRLNLHGNRLHRLRAEMLGTMVRLDHLILSRNRLSDISEDVFDGLPDLRVINTDAYKFCCIAKQVETCTPEPDEFSSCEDLMSNGALQVCIWVLGIVALVGNVFVVVWRLNTDRFRISSFFIINLGFSDLLMGVYLLIIAGTDVHYRGRYFIHADAWRASDLCKTAGVLAMISSEVSVYMLTAITAERLLNFVFPLKASSFRVRHSYVVAAVGWLVVVFASVLPVMGLPYFGDEFFGRTGVCLPFHLSDEKLPGWEYSVVIFLVINLISFIFIFIGYVSIFVVVFRSSRTVQSTSSVDEYSLAKKLAIIVGTDLICWVPIILIGFAALGGAKIAREAAAWIAVFVLPLNSAINPVLYTVSAMDTKRFKKTKFNSRSFRNSTAHTSMAMSISLRAIDLEDGQKSSSSRQSSYRRH